MKGRPRLHRKRVLKSSVPVAIEWKCEMNDTNPTQIHATGEATGFIPAPGDKGNSITVIGTNSIRASFDATCLQQALNARGAPGVTDLVLNPDAHAGYGAPVGCVLTSPTHIYPGPVGV